MLRRLATHQVIALVAVLAVVAGCAPAGAPSRPAASSFFKHAGKRGVIVFVHGVTGDAAETWRNAATGAFWPEMITRDADLADFDIYLAGYDSPLLGRSSTIEEIAQRLLRELRDEGLFERYEQLHFVTHSMGGLVTKRMLTALNRPQRRELERLRRVRSISLISTPSQGAEVATLGRWLSQNPQFANMEPAALNAFIQSLENQWHALLDDRDAADARFPIVFCAYETKPLVGNVVVVSRVYAATRCDEVPASPEFRLTMQMHEVTSDVKGRQFEARQIIGPSSGETPEAVVTDLAQWLRARLAQIYELDRPLATFRLRVPADLSRDAIAIDKTGDAAVEVFLYIVEQGRKVRVRVDGTSALAGMQRDFDLEIGAPGYSSVVRRIRWGRAFDEAVALTPTPLQIGIEEFPGDPGLGARLAAALAGNARIQIKPPSTLAELRRQIEADMAAIARNPATQISLRRSLGLDVLISGRYDVR